MWIRRLLTVCCLLVMAGLAAGPAAAHTDAGQAEPGGCPMSFELPVRVDCGKVAVPEDHREPDGPQIQIAYARLASTSPNPAPDPVVFIDGGPGHPTLLDIELYTRSLAPLIAQRDIILFDQRGVGFSQPGADCIELTAAYLEQYRGKSPDLVVAARACYQRLSASGVNLPAYTTPQVAADIPYLVDALGYQTWNVYGISYGALVALVLMDQQPAGLRSAVLDSALVADVDVIADRAGSGAAGFAAFFEACEEDWLCRAAYPDLEAAYNQAFDRLEAKPAARTIADPAGGKPITLKADSAVFASTAAELLNSDKGRAALPGFIYAVRDGLVEDLLDRQEEQVKRFFETLGKPGTAGSGMSVNVVCADYAPRVDRNAVPEVDRYLVVGGSTRTMLMPCPGWSVDGSDALPARPTRSDISTLILSGDYDSSTPRRYAQHAANTLTNSQLVRFPHAGHGVMFTGQCPIDLVGAFYNQPQAKVDAACVDEQTAAPLIITAGATRPLARWVVLPLFALVGICLIVVSIGRMARLMSRRQTTFHLSARRNLWLGVVLGVALVGLSFAARMERPLDAVVSIVPAMVAVQVALATAPEEEPYLETLLACPRPFSWTLVERWLVLAALQAPVAAAGIAVSALVMADGDIGYAVTQIVSAALLLGGLGALVSVRSRNANMGAIIALLASALFVGRDYVLLISGLETPLPRPFDLVQSVFWMVHPYLNPDSFTPLDYFTNRVIVAGLGLVLLARARALLDDSEYLLVGRQARWLRKRIGQ